MKKKPNQCHVSEFAELNGGGGILEKKTLRGCKSNRKFYRGENEKLHILQRWKTLLTLETIKIYDLYC